MKALVINTDVSSFLRGRRSGFVFIGFTTCYTTAFRHFPVSFVMWRHDSFPQKGARLGSWRDAGLVYGRICPHTKVCACGCSKHTTLLAVFFEYFFKTKNTKAKSVRNGLSRMCIIKCRLCPALYWPAKHSLPNTLVSPQQACKISSQTVQITVRFLLIILMILGLTRSRLQCKSNAALFIQCYVSSTWTISWWGLWLFAWDMQLVGVSNPLYKIFIFCQTF